MKDCIRGYHAEMGVQRTSKSRKKNDVWGRYTVVCIEKDWVVFGMRKGVGDWERGWHRKSVRQRSRTVERESS